MITSIGDYGVDMRHRWVSCDHTESCISGMAHKKPESDYAGDLALTCQDAPMDSLAMCCL
jgi:hypothetical protein